MPITNGNYTTPQWQDNSPPPIDDSEMQAMSDTAAGNQIIVGSGAPTSATAGKIGQRYADMSATPPAIYKVTKKAFDGQPIPKTQTREGLLADDRCRVATYDQYGTPNEVRFGSDDDHNLSVVTYYKGSQYPITFLISCPDSGAICYYLDSTNQQWVGEISISQYNQEYNLYTQEYSILDHYTFTSLVPYYQSLTSAMEACANQPAAWQQEEDPNRNLAREYSTGGSYAAGDCCIHGGKLCRALEAVNGGAWDGTKWEEVRLADELSSHVSDHGNPHEVTAAQTGAAADD